MDPTAHISSVTIFHYLIGAMPLSDDELAHFKVCRQCQALVDDFEDYIDPEMLTEAQNLDRYRKTA